jgi:hypothetical protein
LRRQDEGNKKIQEQKENKKYVFLQKDRGEEKRKSIWINNGVYGGDYFTGIE